MECGCGNQLKIEDNFIFCPNCVLVQNEAGEDEEDEDGLIYGEED